MPETVTSQALSRFDASGEAARPHDAPKGTAPLTLPILAAVILFAAAYANSWRNSFHFDDAHVIETNPAIRSLGNIPRFLIDARTFSSLPANQTFRPVVSTTLAIDYAIAHKVTGDGFDPRPYHSTQLLLLAFTAVLLGLVAREVYARATRQDPEAAGWVGAAAVVAAAWFAVHVANTQVGNYISARSESLSAAGILGGLLLYMRGGPARQRHLYLLPMAAGALSKTPAILLAPLLLLWCVISEDGLDFSGLRAPAARAVAWRAARRAVPAFVAAVVLYLVVEGMNPPEQSYGGGDRLQNLWTQLWVSVRYVALFFVPTGLSADSDWEPLPSPWDVRVLFGAALFAFSLFVAWKAVRTRTARPIAFGIAWFWIGLLPSFAVPLAEVTNDHRPFLAYVGLTMAVVWSGALLLRGARDAGQSKRLATITAALVLVAHAFGTHLRNRVWRSEASLWADVVRASPGNGRGLMNFGLTEMRGARYADALAMFDSATRLVPRYPLLYVNMAIAENARGDTAAALSSFRRALALDPGNADAHHFYARWLANHGRADDALSEYEQAVASRPADLALRHDFLLLLVAADSIAAARTEAQRILALDAGDSAAQAVMNGAPSVVLPSDSSGTRRLTDRWYDVGWSLTREGRNAEAVQAYRQAVAADSMNAMALNNLGWSLGVLGFFDLARPVLERAVALAPRNALAKSNLEWARSTLPRPDSGAKGHSRNEAKVKAP